MHDFSASCARDGEVAIVTVAGEIDLFTQPQVQTALDECLDGGSRSIVMDYLAVEFIDSTGVAMLIKTRNRLIREQRPFAIACATPRVRRVFQLTGLSAALVIADTLDGALATVS